jgi:hypothetical protein
MTTRQPPGTQHLLRRPGSRTGPSLCLVIEDPIHVWRRGALLYMMPYTVHRTTVEEWAVGERPVSEEVS